MNFLYPQFLFALAVLAVPIILHLFHLRRFKTFYFSNVAFLKELDTTSKSTRKIKQFIILLLRCLAFTFLVLAFAQPYFPSQNENASDKQSVRMFFIDNSLSMSANGVEGELLSQAKNMVRELILKDNPGTKYLMMSNHFASEELHIMSQPDAINYVDKLSFSNNSKTIDQILPLIQTIANEQQVTGKLFILSDAQKNQWEANGNHQQQFPLYFVKLLQNNPNNISIDSMWTSKPFFRPGSPFDLNIKVTNHSINAINSIPVKISLNDNIQPLTLEFNGEKEAFATLNFVSPDIGFHTLKVEIEDEQVFYDDVLYGTFEVKSHIDVGVINESLTQSNVGIVYSLDEFHQLSEWNESQIPFQTAVEMDLLVLNQLKRVDPALKQTVQTLLQRGKSVVCIPHTEADLQSWNTLLAEIEMPLLEQTDTISATINRIEIAHPFFTNMFDQANPKISIPSKRKSRLNSSFSRSFSLLSYADGSPFFVKSSKKGQSCYLFNTDLNDANQQIVSSDLFSTLFLRIAENAGEITPLYYTIGRSSQFTIPNTPNEESPLSISNNSFQFIPKQLKNNGFVQIYLAENEHSNEFKEGIYSILLKENELAKIAFNLDRRESNLSVLNENEIIDSYAQAGITDITVSEMEMTNQIIAIESVNSNNLWRILLILALVFLLSEIIVIKFWNKN